MHIENYKLLSFIESKNCIIIHNLIYDVLQLGRKGKFAFFNLDQKKLTKAKVGFESGEKFEIIRRLNFTQISNDLVKMNLKSNVYLF